MHHVRLVLFAVLVIACLGKLLCWAVILLGDSHLGEGLWRPMLFLTVVIVLDLLVLSGLKLAVGTPASLDQPAVPARRRLRS